MIVGVVVGLSITNLLKGIARFIVHPGKEKPYWLHLLWSSYFLVLLIHFWWWEFGLRHLPAWEFADYLYVVVFSTFFYINSALLFPEHLDEYGGFKEYYKMRSHWFFGVLALIYALDVVDSAIKGSVHLQYLGMEYFISVGIHIALCLSLVRVKDQKFHAMSCARLLSTSLYGYTGPTGG